MFLCLIIGLTVLILFFIKQFYENSKYWSNRGIPGPPLTSFIFGHLYDVTRPDNPVSLQLRNWTKVYGSIYGFFEGFKKVLVISDPHMLHELFVKKFDCFYGRKPGAIGGDIDKDDRIHVFDARGNRWKRLRVSTNPAFSANSLKLLRPIIEDSALEMISHMDKHINGTSFNIHIFFQEYTMDVISRIAMGQKESKQFQNDYIHHVLKAFMFNNHNPYVYMAYIMPFLRQQIRKIFLLIGKIRGNLPILHLIRIIEKVVAERIKERKTIINNNEEKEARDMIDMFLDAKVEEIHDNPEFNKSALTISKCLTMDEVVAQCSIFLLAGFDTTANSLSYITFELAKHPDVQKKIQEELDDICINQEISCEDISALKYLDCAVRESLRMYPLAAFASSRECCVSTTLGNIPIQEGVRIMADIWTLHYDTKLWGDDAHEFKPERWESSIHHHVMSWAPFGVGPRQCIGMRLALMEEKLALAHILRRYDIVSDTQTELKLIGCFTTSPEAVNVSLRERKFV